MAFELLSVDRDARAFEALLRSSKRESASFRGLDAQTKRLFRGDYLVLKNRFDLARYGWREADGRLTAIAIHFRVKRPGLGTSSTLGGFLFDPSLSRDSLLRFAERLTDTVGAVELAPANGHMNLGLSLPEASCDPSKLSFLCAAASEMTAALLRESGRFELARTQHAFVTPVTEELREKTRLGVKEAASRGFTSRPLSLLRYKRDIGLYNRLVNAAMASHPNFFPLTFEEEWDILRDAVAIFVPSWFRFLTYEGREVGFCFAFPDYNRVLEPTAGDLANSARLLAHRARGKFRRGRLVYSGILPELKGRGAFKAVRHQVIAEMLASGIREFESSYVDEQNEASIGNVKSTGGQLSHSFELYRTPASPPSNNFN